MLVIEFFKTGKKCIILLTVEENNFYKIEGSEAVALLCTTPDEIGRI